MYSIDRLYQTDIMLSIFLPEDVVLLILSYGDVVVTQKMEDVFFQLKYHLEIFDKIRNQSRFFKIYNPCAGYTIGMFYRSMLRNKKKNTIHWIPLQNIYLVIKRGVIYDCCSLRYLQTLIYGKR